MTHDPDMAKSPDQIVRADRVTDVAQPDPGKRTRTQGPSYVGDAYADHGASCNGVKGDPDCFLPLDVRDRLAHELTDRVQDVGEAYQRACDVVGLQRLMTPATQPNFIAGLLFDIFLGRLTNSIVTSFASMRTTLLARANTMEVELKQLGLQGRLAAVEPATLNAKLGVAVGKVKALAIASAGTDKGTITQMFIQTLKRSAAVGFTALREGLPAWCSDTELMSFREAFGPEYHPQDMYQKAISEKVDRYLVSGVAQIGRQSDTSKTTHSSREEADPFAAVDVRCAYARFTSGFTPRLFFQHTASRESHAQAHTGALAWGSADTQKPGTTKPGLPGGEAGTFWVPEQFTELALQRHIAMWGSLPPLVDMDDSEWYWAPERVKAAKAKKDANKAKPHVVGSSDANVPHLDLRTNTVTPPSRDRAFLPPTMTVDELNKGGQ